MSRAMDIEEFNEVMKFITRYNSPQATSVSHSLKIPRIKYVDPIFAMIDNKCFSIKFRGSEEKEFHTTNESSKLPYSLFQRVMSYLKGAPMGLMVWGVEEARRQARSKSFNDRVTFQIRQIWVDSFVVCPESWEVQDGGLFEAWREGKALRNQLK